MNSSDSKFLIIYHYLEHKSFYNRKWVRKKFANRHLWHSSRWKKTTKDWDGIYVLYKWFNTANTYLNIDASRYRWYFFSFSLTTQSTVHLFLPFPFFFVYCTSPTSCSFNVYKKWSYLSLLSWIILLCSFEEKKLRYKRDSCDNI